MVDNKRKVITIFMHRIIASVPKDMETDHINHNGIDNRRCNLRVCTNQQNQYNQRRGVGKKTSQYKGVHFISHTNKWCAQAGHSGTQRYVGCYTTEIDAAKAYDIKAKELFRDFAYLNIIKAKA